MSKSALVRKHYLLSPANIKKVDQLARAQHCSAAEVVRQAIEAYNAEQSRQDLDALLNIVGDSIAEAISTTRNTNDKLEIVLKRLDH